MHMTRSWINQLADKKPKIQKLEYISCSFWVKNREFTTLFCTHRNLRKF